jgi:hypothetical protein
MPFVVSYIINPFLACVFGFTFNIGFLLSLTQQNAQHNAFLLFPFQNALCAHNF